MEKTFSKIKAPQGDWSGFIGVQGHASPYLVLDEIIEHSCFDLLHEEICLGILNFELDYTGGSHKSMGIVPQEFIADEYADYGQVIASFSDEEFIRFMSLADRRLPVELDYWRASTFGEDGDIRLSRKQIQYLKIRYGVYFPWKAYLELLPGDTSWDDKNLYACEFPEYIQSAFPMTCEFILSLPFKSIGRCNLMGLEANDHATIHRDNYEKLDNPPVNDFITICPAGNKELFLYSSELKKKLAVPGRIYTFNDMNYHGVSAAPFFRYSIRIDGIFTDDFRDALKA